MEWGFVFHIPFMSPTFSKSSFDRKGVWLTLTGKPLKLEDQKKFTNLVDPLHRLLFNFCAKTIMSKSGGSYSKMYGVGLWIVSCALNGVQVYINEIMFDQIKKTNYFPYANMVTYYCYVKKMWNPRYNICFKLSTTHIGIITLSRIRKKKKLLKKIMRVDIWLHLFYQSQMNTLMILDLPHWKL